MLRQAWTGERPVSSICTDRTDFEMLKTYRTNVLKLYSYNRNTRKKFWKYMYKKRGWSILCARSSTETAGSLRNPLTRRTPSYYLVNNAYLHFNKILCMYFVYVLPPHGNIFYLELKFRSFHPGWKTNIIPFYSGGWMKELNIVSHANFDIMSVTSAFIYNFRFDFWTDM